MKNDIGNEIVTLFKIESRHDFTIPEIMSSLKVKNREMVVIALARLEGQNIIELSREKGRAKYYRLKL